tara:strand:+ start:1822 stop:3876 length:2055 start_codon:yes stop_codon:yes gene_type:complete
MSIATQLTSNKSRFNNFYTDPLVLTKNCEVALSKASGSIPCVVTQVLTLPRLATVELRSSQMFAVTVDGVDAVITWKNFYDAWAALPNNIERSAQFGIADFYSGSYELYLNNGLTFTDSTGAYWRKASFEAIFQNALNIAFDFYVFDNVSSYSSGRINDIFDTSGNINLPPQLNGTGPYSIIMRDISLKKLGIRATYNTDKISMEIPIPYDFTGETVSNGVQNNEGWILSGLNSNTLNSQAGSINMAIMQESDQGTPVIDKNGGWVKFGVTAAGAVHDRVSIGLTKVSTESQINPATIDNFVPDDDSYIVLNFEEPDAGDPALYTIKNNGDSSIGYSATNELVWNDGDIFYLRWFRNTELGYSSNSYTIQVYQGTFNTFSDEDGVPLNKFIYQASITLPTNINPSFYCYSDTSNQGQNFTISDVEYIAETAQSAQMFSSYGSSGGFQNSFSIQAVESISEDEVNFFTTIGISDTNLVGTSKTSFEGTPQQKVLQWTVQPQVENRLLYFGIGGATSLNAGYTERLFLTEAEVAARFPSFPMRSALIWSDTSSLLIQEVPRLLEFHINDLSVKNWEGAYAAGMNSYNTGALTRCIGTISVPKQYFDLTSNFNLNYDYEPYNLIYRQINNPNNFSINLISCRLVFKDFITGLENNIETVNGTLKFEVHFQVQAKEERGQIVDNLRPY